MNLKSKIEASIDLIRKGEKLALAMNPDDGYFVGFSGGKDSQVLLELVKMAGVKYKAYYSVTTNDPPENVYFIRDHYPEVIFLHPKKNFYKLIEEKGMPIRIRRYCCEILKEQGGLGQVVLTGVRAEESTKRSKYNEISIISRRKEHQDRRKKHTLEKIEANEHRCIKGKDKLMIYPLLKWTQLEIWEFIKQYKLPLNPCYKTVGRVGCMFCPFAKAKEINMYEKKYPKVKETILKSLDVFIQQHNNNNNFKSGIECYEWWKSKKSIKKFKAENLQLKLDIDNNINTND